MSLTLVLGGTRSGKSEVAERLAAATGESVIYIATAESSDPEMLERIARHRERRPADWTSVEAADPAGVLAEVRGTVIVDGLAPWLARMMSEHGLWTDDDVAPLGRDGRAAWEDVLARLRAFGRQASSTAHDVIVVAEETGLGITPQGAAVRRFQDLAGEATQMLAEMAERVFLVVAGHTIVLKGPATQPLPPALAVHGDALVSPGCLDFAVNVSPWGPPPWLRVALEQALGSVSRYPDHAEAVRALAERHERAPDEILLLNGAAEAFWLLARALRARRAICIHPQFSGAEAALRASGCEPGRVFRDPEGFEFDPATVPQDADLVFVCNPNNPTGTLDPARSLQRLARPGRLLVVDEAYMEFTGDERESLASRADLPGTIVIRSITKLWAIPGLRAGYLLAPSEIVDVLSRARQPWPVNSLALAALVATARDRGTVRDIADRVAAARAELVEGLAGLGVRTWPSSANFVLVEVPNGRLLADRLARRGLAVRPADSFPGLSANHLRITVRRSQDNALLLSALAEELG